MGLIGSKEAEEIWQVKHKQRRLEEKRERLKKLIIMSVHEGTKEKLKKQLGELEFLE